MLLYTLIFSGRCYKLSLLTAWSKGEIVSRFIEFLRESYCFSSFVFVNMISRKVVAFFEILRINFLRTTVMLMGVAFL